MDNQHTHMNSSTTSGNIEKHTQRFHLALLSDADEMHELWLPIIPEGFFQFSDSFTRRFLNISSVDGMWVAICKRTAFFRNVPIGQNCEIPLDDKQLLEIDFEDRSFYLYTEVVSEQQMVYHNYSVCSDVEISIGRQLGNDIRYDNPYVSGKHAVLQRTAGKWCIQDYGSIYGVYVNGLKNVNANLKTGDSICIMGLRIIVGPNFLSVQCGSGIVEVNRRILQDMLAVHSGYSHYYGQESFSSTDAFFNRMPRKKTEWKQNTITIEGPPVSLNQNQIPLMLRLGSSAVMGGAAAMTGNFMTLISGVMFPFLNSKFTDKQRQEYEQLRLTKYREYLANKKTEIENACREEQEFLNRKYPRLGDTINVAKNSSHLWERRPGDSDFLQIRLGTGTQPLSTAIEYPPRRFELEIDKLEEEMYSLVETPYSVKNASIILSLADTAVCGLLGKREQVIEYIRQLLLQVAVFHSYDEVKTLFFVNEGDLEYLDDIRYLPHAWDDQRSMRFIATDEAEAYKLGEYIKDRIASDKEGEKDLSRILKKRPFYLIFALDRKLFDCHEVMKDILQSDGPCGVSIITAFDDLLKESPKIITLNSNQKCVCTTMSADGGDDVLFNMDSYDRKEFAEAMRILTNTRLKTAAQEQELPKMLTFLEMFKVGRIEQLNPLKRWKESNPVKSLATPVGVGPDGSVFMLDLHEKWQGPHGLVAGMTGSGKSEFLITYILSMAINYHPDEVAFVLIDYKGGGLADAFQNPDKGIRLPHLVGTITNLDGPSIQRSLMSIESELVRRQHEFKNAKSLVNEGTMDIYEYQKLYRAGKVSKPMPHLFIISDEFAELKQQQPEFMDKLISAARIGRSLGIHLILATQKPSGVVNDQIRSNTKFRICLRVQERSDSMDMLKRPEAAELTDTGRFYLQVGYNEYFALGQSAWCGAPYEPQDTVTVKRDDTIEFLDTAGQVIARGKPKIKKSDSGMKQIVAVVEYLSELAKTHNIKIRELWRPELPKVIDLESYQEENPTENPMSVCLGKIDDPENLRQMPLVIDFQTCGNMLIVGESGSGKTTMVQNILYSLSKELSPEEFNFYALDYSSRMLKIFKPLPHCGAVLQEEDAGSLDEFFKLINALVGERKRLFSDLEVDSFDAARAKKKIPMVIVAIDNIAGLGSAKVGEAHSYKLQNYLKNCVNYGIRYLVTCNHLNEISSRVRLEFATRLCLRVKDRYDYIDALGCKVNYLPSEIAGRGLLNYDGRALTFQCGVVQPNKETKNRTEYLKMMVQQICTIAGNDFDAKHLPVYSSNATYEDFVKQFKPGRIPLGFEKQSGKLVSIPLKQLSVLSLYWGNPSGVVPVISNLLYAAQKEKMEIWIIKRCTQSVFDNTGADGINPQSIKNSDYLSCTAENLKMLRKALMNTMAEHRRFLEQYCSSQNLNFNDKDSFAKAFHALYENTTPIFLFIESVADFCLALDIVELQNFEALFNKAEQRNVYVIGCFDPDIPRTESSNILFSIFSKNNALLFGGQFDKQTICNLPDTLTTPQMIPYNIALMQYRNAMYPLLMPCGEIEEKEIDEDMQSIF